MNKQVDISNVDRIIDKKSLNMFSFVIKNAYVNGTYFGGDVSNCNIGGPSSLLLALFKVSRNWEL